MEKSAIILLLAFASSAAYRVGGASTDEIPFANSQYRDIGCPVILAIVLTFLFGMSWAVFVSSVLFLLLIRTYHDYTGKDNLFLHGLVLGLCLLPLYDRHNIDVFKILSYSAILAGSMNVVHEACEKYKIPHRVWIDECFRGFILIITLLILK